MCSPESSSTRKHAPPPFGTWGPVQCWEGLQRSPSDWQEGQTPRARAPDLVPFNIINAKRWRRSKVGFCPRRLPKKPFELFENAWLRGGPWLQESAPRLSVEPKIAFRIVRNGCSGSSKIAFSLKASLKKPVRASGSCPGHDPARGPSWRPSPGAAPQTLGQCASCW